ncbi:MAG: outer membrane lipoprotein carrier protein LolA [Treponema sp.]|nr:outer membrane lipoprotein carrier protein LolA [Candidatus Treponema equifaecale]
MKKIVSAIFALFFVAGLGFSQGILTAPAYFKTVSEFYGTIKDYEADVDIKAGKNSMSGKISFKRPDLLRIDFTSPEDQVICFNGDMLTIYLPGSAAILNQSVEPSSSAGAANMSTPQGLALMNRYYSVKYEVGQDPVPLDENSDETVIRLILSRKNASEAFSSIKIAVSPKNNLIRRIEARTPQNDMFTFDFKNYVLNQGISDQRFIYDPPASANNYNNFLYTE